MRKDKGGWKGVTHTAKDSKSDVNRAFNTILVLEHLDDDYYTPWVPMESKTTEQSWLVVGGLEPKRADLPRFSFRWDEKDQHVNVDIDGVTKTEKELFEQGKNGYSGHRALKVEQDGRFFDIDIRIPSKHVFKGRIHFNLGFSEELTVKMKAVVGVSYNLHRGGEPSSHTA